MLVFWSVSSKTARPVRLILHLLNVIRDVDHRAPLQRVARCEADLLPWAARDRLWDGAWTSIISCRRCAASSMSKCLYWPALLSAEITPQRWTFLKSP